MRMTVLMDNVSHNELIREWGLSIHLQYGDKNILLDAGASGAFAENAAALGIDLAAVDIAVLSHAHFDHSDGMDRFFAENSKAKFYLQTSCGENCYSDESLFGHYIGIKKGTLRRYGERIEYVSGLACPTEGMYLLSHSTPGLEAIGRSAGMFRRRGWRRVWEDFSHEQSLVFRTEKGLAVFNSCCHAGADVILQEVQDAFPGEKLYALVGGFHLYKSPAEQVRAFAKRLLDTGVERVWTGHCTGEKALAVLQEEMGEKAGQMYTGLQIEM